MQYYSRIGVKMSFNEIAETFGGHMTKKNDYTHRSQKFFFWLRGDEKAFFSHRMRYFSAKKRLQHIISIYEMRFLVHMHGSSIKSSFENPVFLRSKRRAHTHLMYCFQYTSYPQQMKTLSWVNSQSKTTLMTNQI